MLKWIKLIFDVRVTTEDRYCVY